MRLTTSASQTRAAAQLGVDWVWPHWLERQLDAASPAFVPRGHLPALTNLTGRNWTMVGNVGSPLKAIVDPRGLVTPWSEGWSLDWWIGADDRWHLPSREAGVRQRLVDGAPVVETSMRIPGGDAVQRVYAVPGAEELAVVEIENRSPVPFVIALAVRPYNPEGLAIVERIELVDRTVVLDGRPALLLPKAPARMAGSTFHDCDVATTVVSGRAGHALAAGLCCEVGLAQAAFLYPLPHTAVVRVAIPLAARRPTRRAGLARRPVNRSPQLPARVPTSDEVAAGWAAQGRRGMRLELPPGRLAEAVEANRRFMLLFHDGADITPGPYTNHRFWFRDAAYLLGAMDRYGFHRESAEVLASFPDRQHADGRFFSEGQECDANGAALHAMAEHHRLTGDVAIIDPESVWRGVRWIERKRHTKRRGRDPELQGLMPASMSAEHLGPFDYSYWDSFWSLRGLIDGAHLLRAAGREAEATQADAWAAGLRADIESSIAIVQSRLGTDAIPAGPRRRIDSGSVRSLVAGWPLGLFAPDDRRLLATLEVLCERFCQGPAFQGIGHTGLGTSLTLQLAFVELAAGDRRALDRLQWLVGAATDTFTWPEAIHPQLGTGCMGDGHHGWAAADMLTLVRNLLVREVDGGLALCSMLPEGWVGQPLEVHDAPTHHGLLSFAIRYHGERPALLWDLRPHAASPPGPARISVPGLDPGWSTTELRGDALLGPAAATAAAAD
jgi:hypothetical protein